MEWHGSGKRALTLMTMAGLCAGAWGLLLTAAGAAEAPSPLEIEPPLLAAAFESPVITLAIALCAFWESFFIWGCIQTLAAARIGSAFEIIELEKLLDQKCYADALRFCESRPRYYARLVAVALSAAHRGKEAMDLAIHTTVETEERRGMDRIHALGTLAGVALLVGLFGLCANAFSAIAELHGDRLLFLTLARAAFLGPAFACVIAVPAFLMEATYRRKLPQIYARVRQEAARLIARIES